MQSSISPSLNQSRHQQSHIVIKSLLLQSLLKKMMNGKSRILYSKLKRGKLWYLVEWKGFRQDPERSTCEPAENLKNFPEIVQDFHQFYPENPGKDSSNA
ncbi:hypothetical protein O181_017707 [Austropuccinia psidii MF-1]|uniref:Chromo domain-containing protein n=1 Tax=Austropuccinia psidii MF-1 TaxID=1389203 RepID=A0A9Q3C848_9BASI|nr:hypothetical protein [Austropuccinia psidii MF-1]